MWTSQLKWCNSMEKKKTRKIDTLKKAINMMDQFKIDEHVTPEEVQIKHTISKKTYWIKRASKEVRIEQVAP